MNEKSFTQQSWEHADAGSYSHGRYQIDEYFVRLPGDDVAIASDIIDPDTCQPSEAAARLIAAAPAMFAALDPLAYLAEVLEPGNVLNFRGVYITYEQAQAAAAAIAKAKVQP